LAQKKETDFTKDEMRSIIEKEDDCMEFVEEYSDTTEMLRKYPTDAWMIGCDSNC